MCTQTKAMLFVFNFLVAFFVVMNFFNNDPTNHLVDTGYGVVSFVMLCIIIKSVIKDPRSLLDRFVISQAIFDSVVSITVFQTLRALF